MLGRRRLRLSPERALESGRRAAQLLVSDPGFADLERIGIYAATSDEIATRPLFEAADSHGIRVHFPRCRSDRMLDFAAVDSWEDLAPGRYGLLEPRPSAEVVPPSELGWVIVPGVAFDSRGNRLGRGGGFYDRTFAIDALDVAPALIGFGYEFQLVEAVPAGRLDRKMDAVVTEEEFSWVAGPRERPARAE